MGKKSKEAKELEKKAEKLADKLEDVLEDLEDEDRDRAFRVLVQIIGDLVEAVD